jgi:hypothetical protein
MFLENYPYPSSFHTETRRANILAAGLAVSVRVATIRPEQSKTGAAGAKNPSGQKQKPKS